MNTLLQHQLNELLTDISTRSKLKCESALRVGAATLCRGKPGQITATTVVCDISADDLEAFGLLVADIADEYGLEASIRQQPGSCSVRFTCPVETSVEAASKPGLKTVLARLFRC
jgi:hypothetical protein